MPKQIHLNRPDLAQVVTAALKQCQDVCNHQRLLAMRMTASGAFIFAQIAAQLEIGHRQIFNCIGYHCAPYNRAVI